MTKKFPIILLFTIITSCAYLNIKKTDNVNNIQPILDKSKKTSENNSCVIMGTISEAFKNHRPILIIAYPIDFPDRDLNNYIILEEPGSYMFYIPEGRYYIYTVSDFNNNSLFEQSETSGVYGNPDIITLKSGDVLTNINIEINPRKKDIIKFPKKIKIIYDYNIIDYRTRNGQITKIYSTIFSQNNAEIGWWSPSQFMNALGANIYFVEKYNPEKIPILFVHGAKGSPQDWVYFLIRLDRERYQPWFFYYPTGLRLPLISRLLYKKITKLKRIYSFKKLCLAAHSMGGLITRSMLTQHDLLKHNNFINLYFTFATPWTGFESVDIALATSPKKIPSWIDLASRSTFIRRTMRKRLPGYINHFLFYGRKDSISRERAMDERAFADAKGKYGFSTGHTDILKDKKVFKKFNEILSRYYKHNSDKK